MQLTVFVIFLAVSTVRAEAPPEDLPHDHELSDEQHYGADGEHNPEFDHEAFAGHDGAAEFDDLTPDQSKEKLRKLVKQIDSDSDGFVTHDEMKEWIAKQLRRYIYHDIEGQFSSSDQNQDKLVSWDEYKNTTYSYMDDTDDDPNMKQMINRDKRRFDMADVDKDGKLGTEEFVYFIHPEESKHMGGIIIDETLEDLDKDGDGALSLQEYLGEPGNDPDTGEPPEWVKSETETFRTVRDTNGDGKMDRV
jgi:Ca2+-binding EF-hand superfamily protein